MRESLALLEELHRYLSSLNWPSAETAVHLEKMCCSICNEQLQDCTQRCMSTEQTFTLCSEKVYVCMCVL